MHAIVEKSPTESFSGIKVLSGNIGRSIMKIFALATEFKFFPAEAADGISMLKSISGPFPRITFCPTGGVSSKNYNNYLALDNVACVGGSWIVPKNSIIQEDWQSITALAREAVAGVLK